MSGDQSQALCVRYKLQQQGRRTVCGTVLSDSDAFSTFIPRDTEQLSTHISHMDPQMEGSDNKAHP